MLACMLIALVTMLALAQSAPGGAPPQTAPRNPPPLKRIERHLPGPSRMSEPRPRFEDDPANPTPDAPGAAAAPGATAPAPADPAADPTAAPAPNARPDGSATAAPAPDAVPTKLPRGAMAPRPVPVPAAPAGAAAVAPTGAASPIAQVFVLLMLAPMTLAAAWAVSRGNGTPG
jgi:hypothetical protein